MIDNKRSGKQYKSQSNSKAYNSQARRIAIAEEKILFKDYYPVSADSVLPSCHDCEISTECRSRVDAGLWAACERPDKADLRRVEVDIASYDEKLMSVYYLDGEVVRKKLPFRQFLKAAKENVNPFVKE